MTKYQLQQLLAIIKQQAKLNPYFSFVYDWGVVNYSDKVATANEIMQLVNMVKFPPIGKNQMGLVVCRCPACYNVQSDYEECETYVCVACGALLRVLPDGLGLIARKLETTRGGGEKPP